MKMTCELDISKFKAHKYVILALEALAWSLLLKCTESKNRIFWLNSVLSVSPSRNLPLRVPLWHPFFCLRTCLCWLKKSSVGGVSFAYEPRRWSQARDESFAASTTH